MEEQNNNQTNTSPEHPVAPLNGTPLAPTGINLPPVQETPAVTPPAAPVAQQTPVPQSDPAKSKHAASFGIDLRPKAKSKKKIIIIVVIALLAIGIIVMYFVNKNLPANTSTNNTSSNSNTLNTGTPDTGNSQLDLQITGLQKSLASDQKIMVGQVTKTDTVCKDLSVITATNPNNTKGQPSTPVNADGSFTAIISSSTQLLMAVNPSNEICLAAFSLPETTEVLTINSESTALVQGYPYGFLAVTKDSLDGAKQLQSFKDLLAFLAPELKTKTLKQISDASATTPYLSLISKVTSDLKAGSL